MSEAEKYLYELNNNQTDEQEATALEDEPLSNFDIRDYNIPNSKVLIYNQLEQFSSIDEMFGDASIIFLLYLPLVGDMGHWVLLHKNGNHFEYFCSYGLPIDAPIIKWYRDGQPIYLSTLLGKAKGLRITYNSYPFQAKRQEVSTCGRWCLLRARTIEDGMSLASFIDMMIYLKKKTKRPFDNLVADLIDIVPSSA